MERWYVVWIIMFGFQVSAFAQQSFRRQYEPHHHLWTNFDFEQKVANNIKVGIDIPYRRQSIKKGSLKIYEQLHYYGFRSWMTINLSEEVSLNISPFAYIYEIPATNEYAELENWEDEIRFTFRLKYEPEGSVISHRYSYERRYFRDYEDNRSKENRIRYRLQFNKEISKGYRLIANDELFISFGKDIEYNIFDMNWFFIGIRKEVYPQVKMSGGYRNILEQLSSGQSFNVIHALVLTLSINSTLSD